MCATAIIIGLLLWIVVLLLFGNKGWLNLGLILLLSVPALARDPGGKYADSALKPWFDSLRSNKGLCCSFADGVKIEDVDWDSQAFADAIGDTKVHYRVRLDGKWIIVPDAALITEPNKFGPAVVWPYKDANGETQIRCFIPGAGT